MTPHDHDGPPSSPPFFDGASPPRPAAPPIEWDGQGANPYDSDDDRAAAIEGDEVAELADHARAAQQEGRDLDVFDMSRAPSPPRPAPPAEEPPADHDAGERAAMEQSTGPTPEDPRPRIVCLSAEEISAPPPVLHYPIKRFALAAQSCAVLASFAYGGKSLVAQDALLAVASDGKVWGEFLVNPGPVLHLDFEQGSMGTLDRYHRLARPRGVDVGELARAGLLRIATRAQNGAAMLLTTPDGQIAPGIEDELKRLCEGCALVFVDTLAAGCPGVDENRSEIGEPLYMLGRVAQSSGAAIIVAAHMGKASLSHDAPTDPRALVRGSTAIVAAADYVYAMVGGKGEPKTIAQAKGRFLGDPSCDDFAVNLEAAKIDGYSNPSNPADPGGFRVVYRTAEQAQADAENAGARQRVRLAVLRFVAKESAKGPGVQSGNEVDRMLRQCDEGKRGKGKGKGFNRNDVLDVMRWATDPGQGFILGRGRIKEGRPGPPYHITDKGKAWITDFEKPKLGSLVTCPRCEGSGNLPDLQHVQGGRCMLCSGSGKVRWTPALAAELVAASGLGNAPAAETDPTNPETFG